MLVIEHDMPLIMGDQRPRVLPRARARSSPRAPPGEVRNDPAVIASYLGTDERAIARSGTVPGERGLPQGRP